MTTATTGPVRVDARLDAPLSRWLWLVKWLLVIPHLIVLIFLWAAFAVLTVIAFVAILVTGRYPRAVFGFTLGVLRWTWRVAYYAGGGFGTDRYPPFSLGEEPDYPATLDIAYPEHLSRGLVLVKWWLLAIPHYLVLAFLVGGGFLATRTSQSTGSGLIALLALIAAVGLLFTGRYPRGIWDLLVGLDRWVLRVVAYATLMTDTYPPFRLDMGGVEPGALAVGDVAAGGAAVAMPPPHVRWTGGRVVSVVVGSVLVLGGLSALGGAGVLLAADVHGRDAAGYLPSPTQRFAGSGYALVADPIQLGREVGDPDPSGVLGTIRIRAASTDPAGVFVAVGPAAAVEGYLADTAHDVIAGPLTPTTSGGAPSEAPAQQSFWAASMSGTGTQELTWNPTAGNWAVVVMNSDASRPVVADLSVGATAPGLRAVWIGLFIGAGVALLVGALLVGLAIGADDKTATTP